MAVSIRQIHPVFVGEVSGIDLKKPLSRDDVAAISQVKFPTIEVHISNPIRRGPASQTAAVSQGVVAGFGIAGYELALRGIRDLLAAKK